MTDKAHCRKGGMATRGETKGTAKLSETAVREIRTSAEKYEALAERFHTTPSYVGDIKRKRWWKHLDE